MQNPNFVKRLAETIEAQFRKAAAERAQAVDGPYDLLSHHVSDLEDELLFFGIKLADALQLDLSNGKTVTMNEMLDEVKRLKKLEDQHIHVM